VFFPVLFYLFVISVWVFYFYFYSYFLFFFLYYQLYHCYRLIPTLILFTLPPSPVLKSIALLPNNSFDTSHPLSDPALTFPSHFPPTCHQTTPPSTYSPPADQPTLPLYTNSNTLQSLTHAPYTIKTEIHPNTHKVQNTEQLSHHFLNSPSLPASPFSVTLTNSQISIASLTNINLPTPTVYRQYHNGVFDVIYKQLEGC
jgi:hypothetical protein